VILDIKSRQSKYKVVCNGKTTWLFHSSETVYNGKDAAKIARYHEQLSHASTLTQYLQQKQNALNGGSTILHYHDIARETFVPYEVVKELLYRAAAGSNGITLSDTD
jgi:hypothetical protein